MKNNYSNAMKKIMRKPFYFLTHLAFILIIAMFVGIAVDDYNLEKSKFEYAKENTDIFDPFNEEMEYGQITPIFMSEEFAMNNDESIYYCFLLDEQYYPYIVAVNADDMDKFEDIIEYTYYDVEEPESITLTGKSVEIDSDLIGFAVDEYNVFMGTDNVNKDNIGDQLGYYYLDTTEQPHIDYSATIGIMVFVAITGMLYFNSAFYIRKATRRRKETLATYSENQLVEVDKEINNEDSLYIKSQMLYITKKYIVSSYGGLDIIPLEKISRVYGAHKGNNRFVSNALVTIVETQDGVKHEIIRMKGSRKFHKLKDILVDEIKRRNPEIEVGIEGRFLPPTKINSKLVVDIQDDYSEVTSNVFLGIIGAIIGAAIGGLAWIIISGLSGYLMMYLAIRGYRKLSGFLDKKGQIISLVIVMLMIFFANYMYYALDYCIYNSAGSDSLGNILAAFREVPGYLTTSGKWTDFILSLIIGYGLAIWSGFKVIKLVFSKDDSTYL